jgi:RNA ligase (TIGR02306 family)
MSTFKVEVVSIDSVVNHPGADRLDIAQIRGWRCVVGRDQFKTGEEAVYIPIDAVLPEALVKELGIEKGYRKRVRSIKLRGEFSQGLLMKPREGWKLGDDVAESLQITKWEESIPVEMRGIQAPRDPRFAQYTDIENIKNYPTVFTSNDQVVVTEKIHGTNWRAAKFASAFAADGVGELLVGSHRTNLIESENNLYWRAANLIGVKEKLLPGEQLFGEVYGAGIQDLTYGKKPGEIAVVIFDVMKDGNFLSYTDMQNFLTSKGWEKLYPPVLYSGPWEERLTEYAKGYSILHHSQIKEGVVIKMLDETYNEKLAGRKILKAIGEQYLLRKEGTEGH